MKKLTECWQEYQVLVAQDVDRMQGEFLWN